MNTRAILRALIILFCIGLWAAPAGYANPIINTILGPKGPKQRKDVAKVFGVVVAAPAGQPDVNPSAVAGAQVLLKGPKGSATTTTNKDGAFRFQGLPAGEYIITAQKAGVGTGSMRITVNTNEARRLEPLALSQGGSLLVDESGIILPDSVYVIFDGSDKPIGPDDIARLAGPPSDMDKFMPPPGIHDTPPSGPRKNPTPSKRPSRDGSLDAEDVMPPVEHSTTSGTSFQSNNHLMIIDPQGGNRLEPIAVEGKPSWISFNPAGSKLYVVTNLNSIQVFDTVRGNTILGRIEFPGPVLDLVISPDGTRLYAVCGGESTIQEVDTKTLKVISSLPIPPKANSEGGMPTALAINSEGTKLYVALSGIEHGELVVFDTIMRIPNDSLRCNIEPHPVAVTFASKGNRLFVLHHDPDRISILNLGTSLSVAAVVPVTGKPSRLITTADGTKAYVTCKGNNTVVVLSATGNTLKTIAVGKEPAGVALTNGGKRLYVSNSGDGTVSVIDTDENYVIMNTKPRQGVKPMGVAVKP